MALNATLYKVQLQISDIDRGYYQNHQLTIARHPSETEERMMLRLVAFIFNATENLQFGKGISTDDEPDIWLKDPTDAIDLWIDLGLPDERRVRKACHRAAQVVIYSYGARSAPIWWNGIRHKLNRFDNLQVFYLDADTVLELSALASRSMSLQATLQDSELWLSDANNNVRVLPEKRFPAG